MMMEKRFHHSLHRRKHLFASAPSVDDVPSDQLAISVGTGAKGHKRGIPCKCPSDHIYAACPTVKLEEGRSQSSFNSVDSGSGFGEMRRIRGHTAGVDPFLDRTHSAPFSKGGGVA